MWGIMPPNSTWWRQLQNTQHQQQINKTNNNKLNKSSSPSPPINSLRDLPFWLRRPKDAVPTATKISSDVNLNAIMAPMGPMMMWHNSPMLTTATTKTQHVDHTLVAITPNANLISSQSSRKQLKDNNNDTKKSIDNTINKTEIALQNALSEIKELREQVGRLLLLIQTKNNGDASSTNDIPLPLPAPAAASTITALSKNPTDDPTPNSTTTTTTEPLQQHLHQAVQGTAQLRSASHVLDQVPLVANSAEPTLGRLGQEADTAVQVETAAKAETAEAADDFICIPVDQDESNEDKIFTDDVTQYKKSPIIVIHDDNHFKMD